ncbi:hypothetical protein GCM10010485_12360 [Streptosporangium carneum]
MPGGRVLVTGDFASDAVRKVELPGRGSHAFGPPVVHRGRVYVPDFTVHRVLVVEPVTGEVSSVQVPGSSDDFQLVSRDDRVWVSDPYSRIVMAFDSTGRKTSIDVGDGRGVADKPLTTPTPTPSAVSTPTPASTPSHVSAPPPPVITATRRGPTPRSTGKPPVAKPSRTAEPELETVPDLVGLDREEACARLRPNLRCSAVAQPDGEGETGKVISSDPAAGERVERGAVVAVVYRGPATVPNLVGMPATQACAALQQARLTCREQDQGLAATAAQIGVVTTQEPKAGAQAATGTAVVVGRPSQVQVGSYVNQSVDAACAAVQQAGLTCVQREAGQGAPARVVQAQSPAAGTGLAAGGTVTVDFLGDPAVPDVRGQTPDAACQALRAAKLECAPNDNAQTQDVNKVLAQDPAPGTRVQAGKAVSYTFESTAPVTLNRFKSPAPNRANHLSIGGGPAGWSAQSSLGRVYPQDQAGSIAGLAVVHQFRCAKAGCAEPGSYYFSTNPAESAGFVREGPAFACFQDAVAGTRELHALMNGQGTWVWAVPGTGEWNQFTSTGFSDRFRVCNIW